MKNDWIIDVLTDLQTFARTNALQLLAEQLEDAKMVAHVEMASKGKGTHGGPRSTDAIFGYNPVEAGVSRLR